MLWAVIGFLVGILISLSRWNLMGSSIFSQVVVSISLAYVFNKSYTLWRENTWKDYIPGKAAWVVFVLLTLFNTFVVLYNKLIPEKMIYTDVPASLLAGVFFFVINFMVEISFLAVIHDLSHYFSGKRNAPKTEVEVVRFWLITFAMLCIVWALYLYAAFPGVMTIDTFSQWNQADGSQELTNWYPVLYTLLIRACRSVWNNPASLVILQIIFGAAVFSSGMTLFYKRGLPAGLLYLLTGIFALLPSNGIMMVNLQKDIPFMISFVWLVFLLMRLTWNQDDENNRLISLAGLFFALTLTALFRHNGKFIVYFVGVALVIWSLARKRYIYILPPLLSVAALFIITDPIFKALDIPPPPKVFLNSPPLQDIAGVYIRGGDLSQETLATMKDIMPLEYWEKRYSPYTSDTYLFPQDGDPAYQDYIEKVESIPTSKILNLYLNTFFRTPVDILSSRIVISSLLWNITRPGDDFNTPLIWHPDKMRRWAEIFNIRGIEWEINPLTTFFNQLVEVTSRQNPILYFLFWSAGLSNAVAFLLTYFYFIRRRFSHNLIIVPYISSFGILILSIPFQDFRYIWPHIVYAFLLLLFALADHEQKPIQSAVSGRLQDGR